MGLVAVQHVVIGHNVPFSTKPNPEQAHAALDQDQISPALGRFSHQAGMQLRVFSVKQLSHWGTAYNEEERIEDWDRFLRGLCRRSRKHQAKGDVARDLGGEKIRSGITQTLNPNYLLRHSYGCPWFCFGSSTNPDRCFQLESRKEFHSQFISGCLQTFRGLRIAYLFKRVLAFDPAVEACNAEIDATIRGKLDSPIRSVASQSALDSCLLLIAFCLKSYKAIKLNKEKAILS
ncbi:hypothetical protein VNO77_23462 [Canavalia gladiata]|uniref:Uncharacterized protein n=1 Tax=Canavalia gladiata TaxID=3824 RepID=A0AAN9L4I3_CANGL